MNARSEPPNLFLFGFGMCIRPIVRLILLPTITVVVRLHPRHVFPEVQTSNNPFWRISPARGRVKPPTNCGDRAGIRRLNSYITVLHLSRIAKGWAHSLRVSRRSEPGAGMVSNSGKRNFSTSVRSVLGIDERCLSQLSIFGICLYQSSHTQLFFSDDYRR